MKFTYLNLEDWSLLASEVLCVDRGKIPHIAKMNLADSALNAPSAGFGDDDIYPNVFVKAAILGLRLAQNHPLPDGNKRTSFVAMVVFLKLNGIEWEPPSTDEIVQIMIKVASSSIDEDKLATWLKDQTK